MTAAPPFQVAVLMATYNGAEFLPRQLDSLAAQTHENWRLWVSDDGSADATLDILRRRREAWGRDRLRLQRGPGRGFQANFLTLTARQDLNADYFAWSDQDDIWLPEKLARSLARLAPYGQDEPALYCGRTVLMDSQGRDYGFSPLLNRRPPAFLNALLQNCGGGNTMVFNRPARELIIGGYPFDLCSHDWWAYQIVSGCGGRLIYDPEPLVRYRQHGKNLVGCNRGWRNRWNRLQRVLAGDWRRIVGLQLAALQKAAWRLTPENRRGLENLLELRRCPNPFRRLRRFLAGGFHRQFRAEQLAMGLAVFMGRV
ncbi:MAG: glycosyltransferase family 2 protein [Candidatus Adiutrix sp.]|jgi:glycosyltransferase involved in cell wall biosynthesis|nr:glycosyltransferase family 2 protein [Candidatus Adiutrix sp.]